jgi:hypothetical protein
MVFGPRGVVTGSASVVTVVITWLVFASPAVLARLVVATAAVLAREDAGCRHHRDEPSTGIVPVVVETAVVVTAGLGKRARPRMLDGPINGDRAGLGRQGPIVAEALRGQEDAARQDRGSHKNG